MIQFSTPLPPDMPVCVEGPRPQLVQTRGAPTGLLVGARLAHTWHIECWQCQVATVPHASKAIAESRWRADPATHRIPLSDLGRARMAAAATHAA